MSDDNPRPPEISPEHAERILARPRPAPIQIPDGAEVIW